MFLAYRFLEHQSPEALSKMLWQHKIGHQITFNQGVHELWVVDKAYATEVHRLIAIYEGHAPQEEVVINSSHAKQKNAVLNKNTLYLACKQYPVTLFLIAITLLVSLITQLGTSYASLGWFTITPIIVENNLLYSMPLSSMWDTHAYWRLLTPAFVHFSMMHLVFNLLWVWEIGRKIEKLVGAFVWLIGVLIMAVASNTFQYWDVQSPLFGGLSGVVYGCIGFAWLMPYIDSKWPRLISKGLMMFFLIWLGIGYTDLPSSLGLGNMANTAHLVGLVSGLVCALVYGLLIKRR
ncbi:rhomboid family intramembrane serine protease [Marinomonas sp. 15G1-11]|uniref:Rhomboid family intramembrane serine protease n=1 Tax=Marinomonas phaeophyticola TaxID=3004091 RepID=A0ABT4JYL9_9GAMM|nr:rhomboid family intramembrane serine protease [Marinomonas sp. 15G1-11]MCZ2723504.1 rhomboid family intramembrane serine protease [Marinomonas sp. 15G1-11]